MKPTLKTNLLTLLFFLFLPVLATASQEKEFTVAGETMGTTYHVTVVTGHLSRTNGLKEKIDKRLHEINRSMSPYLKESEISRFNRLKNIGEMFCPSPDFFSVMRKSRHLHGLTHGAWDPTVGPLVDLWGFGRVRRQPVIPSADAIDKARQAVGFAKIKLIPEGCLAKGNPDLTLDLGSIAKGYGVDAVARVVEEQGFENFLVEIGGEVFVKGVRLDGAPWRIGINTPLKTAAFNSIYRAIPLAGNRAMATSGTYRNFFEANGKTYSHVIDPRTGFPVQTGVVSVSVIAGNCTVADGLATALMVLGHQKGLDLVKKLPSAECLIIVQDKSGKLIEFVSQGFSSP